MKYHPDALKKMAQTFLEADKKDDPRCFTVLMMVSLKTGLTPNQVLANIRKLERGVAV